MARQTTVARLSAAERREEVEKEAAAKFAIAKAEYPHRLMKLMAAYNEIHKYEFKAQADVPLRFKFTVIDDDGYLRFEEILGAELESWNMYYNLESAERTVEEHYEKEREQQRRYEVLKEAKRKVATLLNDEERELLGL